MEDLSHMSSLPRELIGHAREFIKKPLSFTFTKEEEQILAPFFTNPTQRVFFIHNLPSTMTSVLLAMYSRIKNPRGIRGIFVDAFLPEMLVSLDNTIRNNEDETPAQTLKRLGIKNWNAFISHPTCSRLAKEFSTSFHIDPAYLQTLTDNRRLRKFLDTYLDAYGHNSIARTGVVYIGLEGISILAAKSAEWVRPGAGFIELSTRFVDMAGKDVYPIEEELMLLGVSKITTQNLLEISFAKYRNLQGTSFTGPFPSFLRDTYREYYRENEKDLESGVIGETCDVLGNFLPSATLTSLGIAVSGESLPQLLKHFLLDETPENIAIAEAVIEESYKTGANQFVRHIEPTPWERDSWAYLVPRQFKRIGGIIAPRIHEIHGINNNSCKELLLLQFSTQPQFYACQTFGDVISYLSRIERSPHDKLPYHFEHASVTFSGVMSFRGYRDLQRHGLCTHARTLVTPEIGFYRYTKPAPDKFKEACERIHLLNGTFYETYTRVASMRPQLMQYAFALGNMVGFTIGMNLRELEFVTWQRSGFNVNHEVREIALDMEHKCRDLYPWWKGFSRADIVPAYIFARGSKGIPLPK